MGLRRRAALPLALAPAGAFGSAACAIRIGSGTQRQSSASQTEREAPRIEVDAAFAELRAGRAVLVDVRGPESFRQRRAAGAVLLPLDDIEKAPRDALARLPAGLQPILYCT